MLMLPGNARPSHHGAAFGQRGVAAEFVVRAVKIVDVLRDDHAFRVLPRTIADAIAGVDALGGRGFRGAEIGVPSLAACARRRRKLLTMGIRARQAAEITALADGGAGDEEGHIRRLWSLLRLRTAAHAEQQHRCRRHQR
jgi:hypothetical protein